MPLWSNSSSHNAELMNSLLLYVAMMTLMRGYVNRATLPAMLLNKL